MSRGIVVAIDGPAASGKSTTARAVAERLGYAHLNSGSLYRAIAWAAIREGWVDDEARFGRELERLELAMEAEGGRVRVRVNGCEPGRELVSSAVDARVSAISARPAVRAKVLEILRRAGAAGGVVCDGRDIGTVVFPEAALKVFLVADPAERALRRLRDRGEAAEPAAVEAEAAALRARDEADATRAHSPLRPAADAVRIDTTRLTPAEVTERIVGLARRLMDAGG